MTTAWAHLPNATHIDRVLTHLKQHPDRWDAARGAAWNAAWNTARDAAWNAVWNTARDAAWNAVWNAAGDAARDAAGDAAGDAVWNAIVALVAWDDCAYLLNQTPDLLRAQINLVGDHRAVLLLPAVIAMSKA